MSFEQKVNYQLNKYPRIKKMIKRGYQLTLYAISPKIKSEGDIMRISPADDKHEYFFGYYDKSPWDIYDRYMLCLRANNTWSDASPKEKADILLINTEKTENDPERVTKIAETSAWNVQQACMLQWLGPDYSSKILYNDYRDGQYCSIIKEVATGKENVIPAAVYTVSSDGKLALTLDFSRLYNLRPGYGYHNVPETTFGTGLPDAIAIWTVDLENGNVNPLLKYTDFASYQPRPEMLEKGSVHKVNHLMLSPNGRRFMVLYRWFNGQRKYTRLITCNVDGTDMYVLSDDDMVSHCCWKDDQTILAFENKKGIGPGYYLMKDKTQSYIHCWSQLNNDGHPSYNPDRSLIVTDTYPNRTRIAEIKLMDGADETSNAVDVIAKVFAPFKYDNDTRCDLHPRWNHRGDKLSFDGVFEGHRGLYVVHSEMLVKTLPITTPISQKPMVTCVIPSFRRCKTVTRAIDSVLAQTYKNIEVCLVDDNTPEDEYSQNLQKALTKYEGDKRVRYIVQKKHINGAAARNIGIKAAHGEYIGFLDDDDEWLPEKIERQMMVFQNNSSLDAVTTLWTLYEDGKEVRKCAPYTVDSLQFKILMRSVAVFTPTVLIKKSAIERFGGFDVNLLRHQDLQFLVDALKESKFEVLREHLVSVYADSRINRPDVEKLIKAKEAFFKSVNDEFSKYNRSEQKRIMNAHYYEVALQAFKARDYRIVIEYMLKAGINFVSLVDLIKRYMER